MNTIFCLAGSNPVQIMAKLAVNIPDKTTAVKPGRGILPAQVYFEPRKRHANSTTSIPVATVCAAAGEPGVAVVPDDEEEITICWAAGIGVSSGESVARGYGLPDGMGSGVGRGEAVGAGWIVGIGVSVDVGAVEGIGVGTDVGAMEGCVVCTGDGAADQIGDGVGAEAPG